MCIKPLWACQFTETHHNQLSTVTSRETRSDPIRLQQYLSPQNLSVAACSHFLSTFSSLPVTKLCLRHLISTGPSVIFQAKVLLNGKPQLTQQLNSNVWHGFLMQHIWVWRYRLKKCTGKFWESIESVLQMGFSEYIFTTMIMLSAAFISTKTEQLAEVQCFLTYVFVNQMTCLFPCVCREASVSVTYVFSGLCSYFAAKSVETLVSGSNLWYSASEHITRPLQQTECNLYCY